jgi:Tfp pilus assembly pilus retraction ATPase PilT
MGIQCRVLGEVLTQLLTTNPVDEFQFVVGETIVVRVNSRIVSLESKLMAPADTEEVMQFITPPHHQTCRQQVGLAEFEWALSDTLRYLVTLFKPQGGNIRIFARRLAATS